jgi:hypothetical protein
MWALAHAVTTVQTSALWGGGGGGGESETLHARVVIGTEVPHALEQVKTFCAGTI